MIVLKVFAVAASIPFGVWLAAVFAAWLRARLTKGIRS
jgi:hypothetical protein